jgi:hypothetical protein
MFKRIIAILNFADATHADEARLCAMLDVYIGDDVDAESPLAQRCVQIATDPWSFRYKVAS